MFCSFCNNEIPKGTGEIYVLRDGTALSFCSSKCRLNHTKLRREGRLAKWTAKGVIVTTEKKAEEKKESALAHEIEKKLEEKKTPGASPAAKK